METVDVIEHRRVISPAMEEQEQIILSFEE